MKTVLFNPFAKYSDRILLTFGFIITLFGGVTGYSFNAVYDGALDLHFINDASIYQTVSYLAVDILTVILFLFAAGKIINAKTRLIDITSTTLIGRIPLYILSFFNIGNYLFNITSRMMTNLLEAKPEAVIGSDMIFVVLFGMITLVFVVWFFVLLWNGFKVSTNAKGAKSVVFFVIAVFLAEILSKTIIYYL